MDDLTMRHIVYHTATRVIENKVFAEYHNPIGFSSWVGYAPFRSENPLKAVNDFIRTFHG